MLFVDLYAIHLYNRLCASIYWDMSPPKIDYMWNRRPDKKTKNKKQIKERLILLNKNKECHFYAFFKKKYFFFIFQPPKKKLSSIFHYFICAFHFFGISLLPNISNINVWGSGALHQNLIPPHIETKNNINFYFIF